MLRAACERHCRSRFLRLACGSGDYFDTTAAHHLTGLGHPDTVVDDLTAIVHLCGMAGESACTLDGMLTGELNSASAVAAAEAARAARAPSAVPTPVTTAPLTSTPSSNPLAG
ncbi:hypothetical protein [Streptomyces sp. NPDC001948]